MSIAVDQWPKRHLIDVDEYYKMAEVGLLAPDARVELIEGEVIDMAPIGTSHARTVQFLMKRLMAGVRDRAEVTVQQPVRLSTRTEPQPDLMLLKQNPDLYRNSHPTSKDVLLLIEVSDTTLKFDRGPKLALYAKHGIPEVWVVDLVNQQLHRMREPSGEQYRISESLDISQTVAPVALPDIAIQLAELFG